MRISEVARQCGLTRKAIDYYEQQGLLVFKYDANGYRSFSNDDVTKLKEITIYRKLGMGVSDIKAILGNEDKQAALRDYKLQKEIQLWQLQAQYEGLNYLLDSKPAVEEAFAEIGRRIDTPMMIKDRLLQAFPGIYGMNMFIHFGRFLEEKLDTPEKTAAYFRIVEFLDHLENPELPEELQQYVEEVFHSHSQAGLEQMDKAFIAAIEDHEQFMQANRETLEGYLHYRNSEAYTSSPTYKMQQIMLQFQKNSGYYDIFIPNLKILSSTYRSYYDKLQAANLYFLTEFPGAERFYHGDQGREAD